MADGKAILVSLGVPDPERADDLKTYQEGAGPILTAAGATVLAAGRHVQTLVGDREFQTVFIAEFPSEQAIRDVWAGEAYRALVPARDRAFRILDQFIVRGR